MYTMAPEPISTAHLINASHQYVRLHVYVSRQQLGTNVTAAMKTHATIEQLLDALFSMRSVSYVRRVSGSVCVLPYHC
jgi:hypothetical protein